MRERGERSGVHTDGPRNLRDSPLLHSRMTKSLARNAVLLLMASVHGFVVSATTGPASLAQQSPPNFWRFGESVDRAGDLDGDGVEDWVISDQKPGKAWVVSGRDGRVLRLLDLELEPDGVMTQSMTGLGDVDGDGVPDIGMVTCCWDCPPIAAVFSGSRGCLIRSFNGCSLLGMGDVDGDGCADVLVVRRGKSEPHRVLDRACLTSGRSGQLLWTFEHPCGDWTDTPWARPFFGFAGCPGPDAIFTTGDRVFVLRRSDGSSALSIGEWNEISPRSATSAGDVDGDGSGDLIVGFVDDLADLEVTNWKSRVLIYSGRTGRVLSSRSGEGGYPGEFGDDVDGAGDIDGDGIPDVLVTTHSMLEAPNGILVLSGRTGRVLREILPDLPDLHRRFCVRSIPDVDGDGVNDILAGITPWRGFARADGFVEVFSGRTGRVLWRFRRNEAGVESTPTPVDVSWTR